MQTSRRRGQLEFGAAAGIDSDDLQQFGFNQGSVSCASHANGAAQAQAHANWHTVAILAQAILAQGFCFVNSGPN